MWVSRWIHRCRSWMHLSRKRWLPVLLRTSPPISGRRNWLRAKVRVKKAMSVGWQICFGLFFTGVSASALSLEPYGLSLPISMSSCSITDRQSPTLLSISSGLSGNSVDRSHKGGYVNANFIHCAGSDFLPDSEPAFTCRVSLYCHFSGFFPLSLLKSHLLFWIYLILIPVMFNKSNGC